MADELGLPVPRRTGSPIPSRCWTSTSPPTGRTYVLKSIPYDPVRRLDLTPLPRPTPAETEAFVRSSRSARPAVDPPGAARGTEYCTHGTVRDGRLQVYVCCAVLRRGSSPTSMVDKPEIRAWVERFVAAGGLDRTGCPSTSSRAPTASARAIECNPRTHSAITLLHGHPGLARRLPRRRRPLVEPPLGGAADVLAAPRAVAVRAPPRARRPAGCARCCAGTDAVLDRDDPLPFLALHHLHVPSLLLAQPASRPAVAARSTSTSASSSSRRGLT